MAQAAIPILAGTGLQIIGANQGWDPRLTALASIAAGGIGAGLTTGAFSGGVAAQAASGVASSVNPHAGMLANAFTPSAAVAPVATDLSYSAHAAGPHGMDMYASQSAPTWRKPAVAEVKAPFFDRTQKDGSQGLSTADSLGINMMDTFLQYELALAQQPEPRPTRSGGGGGGGGGGMAAPYQGGGGSNQKQVTWGFGGGNNNGYQPQGLV